MYLRRTLIAASLLMATALPGVAATYYVAPVGTKQSCTSDGSSACPWTSVAAAFASKKIVGGDTVLLKDGSHGALSLDKLLFDKPVTIQSETGKNAHVDSAHFGAATKNITLKNVKAWRPEGADGGYIVRSYEGSTGIVIEGLDIRAREDSLNYMNWSQSRWLAIASDAVQMRGSSTIRNNTITGVGRGIMASANAVVEGNVIDGFVWDGMRGGSNSVFRNNVVKNCFKVDSTHRDGFQSYSTKTVTGLTVEGNIIIEWAHATSAPLRGTMQGIGLFDGYYDDLVIRNNVVAVGHYHGIAVAGTRRASIVNNTVVNINGTSTAYPWIRVGPTKAGLPSEDVIVANNVAMKFSGADPANNVIFDTNSVIIAPAKVLQDITKFDYRPRSDSGFIDTAKAAYAPATDVLGNARPSGNGPDRGAYEVGGSGSATPLNTATTLTKTTTAATATTTGTTTTTTGAKRVKAPKRTGN